MARTFIRQAAQISSSETFTDNLPMGSGLASQASLEGDLNALRTLVRAAVGSAAWYTAPVESLSSLKSRVDAAALDIEDLEAALTAEIARAEAAEGLLQSNIEAEAAARDLADVGLQAGITAEKNNRIAADGVLQSNINAEALARSGADNALNASILQEVSDRQAAVTAEQLAREAADVLLTQSISDEVAAREAAILQEVSDRDAAIAQEAFAREAADQILTDALAAEVVNRTNADSDLADAIAQEVMDRGAAILTEKTERQAGDLTLAGLINTEIGNRQAADTTLQANIDAEAVTRGAADAALDGRLDTAEADLVDLHENKLSRDGSQAMTGALDMGSFGISNLAFPTNPADATTKAYVDALVTGLKLHEPVLARMNIVNGQFTGAVADGVQLVTGSRVFVVDSQNATNSGIYVAMISGPNATFARAADFAAGAEVDGAFFFCQQGDTYADTSWVQTSSNPVGQGPLSFSMMFSPGDYSAGAGLDLTDKVFSVEPEGIVNSMLASGSVSEGKILDLAVSESKLASLSVSTGKIKDLAVTEAKLASSSVATSKLADLAVTEAKIAAAAVATAKIADLAVTTAKVADAAITQAKLSLVAPVANLDAATKLYVDERGFGTKVRLVVEGGLYATLQAAVDAAVANDVILVGPKASGDWGNVSFPTDKRLMVSALGGMQEQKVIKIGTVTFDTSGGAGNVNNNEVYLSGLHITGSFSTQAVLFQGTAPARLRMSNCYVYNLGSGDGIVCNNNAANSSLYLDSVLAQSSSVTGTVLKHTKGFTFIKNRSMFEGGLYAASCAAGVVEAYDSSFSMSGAREAVLVSGTGIMTLGYSTIQNTNTSSSAIGVNISSAAASFGAGDATISVGAYGVTPAGKAVTGSGYYSFGNVTYGYATTIGVPAANQLPASRTGGIFTTALSMSSNKITSLATPTVGTDAANKQYVDDQAALKLSLSGGTMSGALAMGGKAITGVLNPVNAQDAATKKYVDDSITGLDSRVTKVFAEVLVDVNANTALAGGPNGNLSVALPSMPADATVFSSTIDIYLNGQLLRAGAGNDVVRDSITATALLLSFPAAQGDILCVIQYS